MIKDIGNGWANIVFENTTEEASYLTDIPIDILNSLKIAFENNIPAVLFFNCEGYEIYITLGYYESYLCSNKEEKGMFDLSNRGLKSWAKEICDDIENQIENWSEWGYEDNKDSSRKIKRRETIELLLKDVKKYL